MSSLQVAISPACPTECDSHAEAPFNDFNKYRYAFDGKIVNLPADENVIMKHIMADGPVEAAFSVYSDFENYVGGIYHKTSSIPLGGHAIKIVGWGEEKLVPMQIIYNSSFTNDCNLPITHTSMLLFPNVSYLPLLQRREVLEGCKLMEPILG